MANVGQSHLLHNVLDVFCDHIAWMGEYPCMMTYCAHSPLSSCWPSYDRKGAPVCSMHLLTWSHLYLTHSPLGGILGSRLNVFMHKTYCQYIGYSQNMNCFKQMFKAQSMVGPYLFLFPHVWEMKTIRSDASITFPAKRCLNFRLRVLAYLPTLVVVENPMP